MSDIQSKPPRPPIPQMPAKEIAVFGIVPEGWALIGYAFLLVFLCGCGSSQTVSPEITERAAELSSGAAWQKALDSHANALATTLAAQKLTGEQTLETAQAIMAKLNTLEASLSTPKPNGQEVIKSAPEPPAKANTQQTPVQVATPGAFRTASDGTRLRWNVEGNWNPTILETSAHLRQEHGIDTNGMTHQEMADIHAALHDGKTVATKSKVVKTPVTEWSWNGTSTYCPSGRCPQVGRRGQR